jgi:hypothetical protein
MTTATDHPFTRVLLDAASGSFPDYDRTVEVVGSLPGPCDAVAFLPGHTVVAADVSQRWLDEQGADHRNRSPRDRSTGLAMGLAALREELGNPDTYASLVAAAPYRAAVLRGRVHRHEGTPNQAWAAYRTEVESHRYEGISTHGRIDLGRGPGGRIDLFVQVDSSRHNDGSASRDLLATAKTLIPPGERVFATAPVHDIRALRTMLAGGFTPICTEVLFLTRPAD